MNNNIRQELIERYEATGKIGFTKPSSTKEAYQIIETLSQLCEPVEKEEEVVINLSDITEKLRNFFKSF